MNGVAPPVPDAAGRSLEIRDARVDDLPRLQVIFRRASLSNAEDRALLTDHPELLELTDAGIRAGRTRVAVSDGQIAGFATVDSDGDPAELDDLFVDPDAMRSGIGRALVADACGRAAAAGRRGIQVLANGSALEFYRAVGFVGTERVPLEHGVAIRMHVEVGGRRRAG